MNAMTTNYFLHSVAIYMLVFSLHALRRRITIAPLYVLLGGLGWVMWWITDAAVRISLFGTPVLIGSTIYFTAIIVTVFIIYLFDEPEVTRRTLGVVIGIAIVVPVTSAIIRSHAFWETGTTTLLQVPLPHMRLNVASITALVGDVIFLIFGWDLLSRKSLRLPLGVRVFLTLLAVMWLDALLFGTGAFLWTSHFWNHIIGTTIVRFWTVVVIFPFLWFYVVWQKSRYPILDGEHVARNVFSRIAFVEKELQRTQLTLEQQLKAEEKLKESETRFRALFEKANDAIFLMDGETFIDCNPKTLAMFRCRREEIIGKPPTAFSPARQPNGEQSNDSAKRRIEAALDGTPQFFEWQHNHLDGTPFDAEVSLNRIELSGKKFLLAIVRDISRRKQGEREREKLETQLHQSQKMESIGRLAGGVAHDYNNMLSVIIGHAELALERLDQPQAVRSDLDGILKASQRSAEITRQLLTFARRQTINPRSLDLNQVIAEMLGMLNRLIGEDVDLSWLPGTGVWPVRMDSTQVDQILVNLSVNARDAIEGVGKITIETSNVVLDEAFCKGHPGAMPGEYVQLSVSDNGAGMDTVTIEQIFEPFFTTKKIGKGTGLGLATVYGIVKQNDGFVNVYSEPELGTTFKIYFRRYSGSHQPVKIEEPVEIVHGLGERILLVEDEMAVRNLGEMMLINLGYQVISASSPNAALKLVAGETKDIEVLITDVVMPEMNGHEFASRMQEQYPDIKVIFMSGYTANVIAHRGVLEDGVNFLQKPFTIHALATQLRAVLDD